MRLFDLHCDTLYKAALDGSDLYNSDYEINLYKAQKLSDYRQLCAVWIPDDIRGEEAEKLFNKCLDVYRGIGKIPDNIDLMRSVESGAALAGKIENIAVLSSLGVKAMTLTWNGENELGGGAHTDIGLSDFGKRSVSELEKHFIAVDISHSSDKLFYDVLSYARKPIIATHSNSRAVTDHKRNLTDDQFIQIKNMNGLVGLTFHNEFMNNDPKKASAIDLIRHAEHFLDLGGEDILAIGSDFDGGELPCDIKGLEDIFRVRDMFAEYFGEELTEKIFFENAEKFFRKL